MWRRLIYHPEIDYALRATLVLCLPVAVGLIIGQLRLGLLFSLLPPACCNIAGLDTPHKRFFKRLAIGASLFAGCSLIMQLLLAQAIPLPLILTGLTLILGVTAEAQPSACPTVTGLTYRREISRSAHGRTRPVSGNRC